MTVPGTIPETPLVSSPESVAVDPSAMASECVPVYATLVVLERVAAPQWTYHPWVVPSSKSYWIEDPPVAVGLGLLVGVGVGDAVGVDVLGVDAGVAGAPTVTWPRL
jgi:hypothetical protein